MPKKLWPGTQLVNLVVEIIVPVSAARRAARISNLAIHNWPFFYPVKQALHLRDHEFHKT